MKNLNGKRYALALFAVFAVSFLGVALLSGRATALDLWTALTIAYKTVPIVAFVAGLFVSYMWRWKIFAGWLVPYPDLNGTWQGTLQTTWEDPNTGVKPEPIPAILTVKQSFVRISCVMRTKEMTSRSFLADFWLDGDEQIRKLGFSYHSFPLISIRDRSQVHDGTAVFELIGHPVSKLVGPYWTDRKTTGEMVFTFRGKDLLEEFPEDLR